MINQNYVDQLNYLVGLSENKKNDLSVKMLNAIKRTRDMYFRIYNEQPLVLKNVKIVPETISKRDHSGGTISNPVPA